MNWGKVIYVFFALMSLTTTAGFIYAQNELALFAAASANAISTILKIGVRNFLAGETFASSLVADLHLIPALIIYQVYKVPGENIAEQDIFLIIQSLAIGAVIANVFSLILVLIDANKQKEEF